MKNISLPNKIEIKPKEKNVAQVIIEPFYPGYGITVGNSLRRVLLSSLPGAAITGVKIKGVSHEFSTLPNVKEDLVEVIMNLKLARFKLLNVDETKAVLKVKGEKEVTAKDIKKTSDFEIINPELHVATLTDPKAELEMEIFIKVGLGYWPVEAREKEKLELGVIAIDAIFSPVVKVNFKVENVRVEQMTNFDKLTLDIVTDGSIAPEEAFMSATQILLDHYNCFLKSKNSKEEDISKKDEKKDEKEKKSKTTKKK